MVLGLLIGSYFAYGTYSTGSRAGTIIKLSKKGVLFKTWEGELNMTMFVGDMSAAAAIANLWKFSVHRSDTAVVRILNDAMLSGQRVKLDYDEHYIRLPWNGETTYFVTKVELLHK